MHNHNTVSMLLQATEIVLYMTIVYICSLDFTKHKAKRQPVPL